MTMTFFLTALINYLIPFLLGIGTVLTLIERAKAKLMSNGFLVMTRAELENFEIEPSVREALERRGVRDLPPARKR